MGYLFIKGYIYFINIFVFWGRAIELLGIYGWVFCVGGILFWGLLSFGVIGIFVLGVFSWVIELLGY